MVGKLGLEVSAFPTMSHEVGVFKGGGIDSRRWARAGGIAHPPSSALLCGR